ncbi:hypothetical protein DNI29_19720 [Hymenobacter sediminis]|uniref:hypothetical protein n=1 Tax=Hymenobacter sediminis TaxID=2218621 RepID=UPI000DA68CD8|nr:hypothetical protein [Hymenobacter sediminis]RPD44929.1 hypothetical protein DNI29_19720 [Hymenobacter sediminis]
MTTPRRFRFTPLFFVGFLFLVLGLTNPKRLAFAGVGAVFIALGVKRGQGLPPDEEPEEPMRGE